HPKARRCPHASALTSPPASPPTFPGTKCHAPPPTTGDSRSAIPVRGAVRRTSPRPPPLSFFERHAPTRRAPRPFSRDHRRRLREELPCITFGPGESYLARQQARPAGR